VQHEIIHHLIEGVMTMTPRTPAVQTSSSPLRRLWGMGSVLLIGAAVAAFSVGALAGGHRGHPGDHGPKGYQRGDVCMHGGHMGQQGGQHMMGGTRHLDRLLGAAKLTDAQRTQIRDIQAKTYADLKNLHTQDPLPMAHGLSLLSEAKPDAAAAEQARQEMMARHDKASQRMLQAQLDIANVLTPAQRAQIGTTLKAREERMKERMSERAQRRAERQAARAASQPAAAASASR
jgi:periplasmic protein CpxP/Spy